MKIKSFTPNDGIKAKSHRKENNFDVEYAVIAVYKNEFRTPVRFRFYNTNACSYCCIWLSGNEIHASGSGRATGYGYHRPSAALYEALLTAGITLDSGISGRGDSAIEEAIACIARKMGFKKFHTHKSHA